VVMITMNFDGLWTSRVVEKLGYRVAQGSSSRGGTNALNAMAREVEAGWDVAFTPDGPRGPRYVAKPGPVMVARRTGKPVTVFHIGFSSACTFEKSWDRFRLPFPFSRAVLVMAPPIYVSIDADSEEIKQKISEMQAARELVRDVAESRFQLSETERQRLRREWDEERVSGSARGDSSYKRLSLTHFDGHVHFLAVAKDRQRDRVTRARAIQQKIQIHLAGDRFAVHCNQHVAANPQFLKTRKHGFRPATNASLRGRPVRSHSLNKDAFLNG